METLLIAVTAVSLAMAVGLAIVVLKLVRDDRRRSEARVMALTAMSAAPVRAAAAIRRPRSGPGQPEAAAD